MLSQLRRIRAKGCKTCVAFHGVKKVWMPSSIDWPIDGDDPKRSEGGIPKNADGKNQASEDVRRMLCKRHLGFQEGKHVQNEKALPSIWDRKKLWCRGQKRSEQRGVVSERKHEEDDFSWSISSTGSKS